MASRLKDLDTQGASVYDFFLVLGGEQTVAWPKLDIFLINAGSSLLIGHFHDKVELLKLFILKTLENLHP